MEKQRFVVFLVLSLAIWAGYIGLRFWLFPEPPQQAKKPDVEQVDQDDSADGEETATEKAADPPADSTPSSSEGTASVKVPSVSAPKTPAATNPLKRLTLGSLDPEGPYRMLVTFTSQGAGVERVELSSNRYRDLEDKSGYLGELVLTNTEDGPQIGVVGPGTPAANAKPLEGTTDVGLQVGDIVETVNGLTVASASEVAAALNKTRPGQEIEVGVVRKVDDKPTNLRFQAALIRRPLELIRPEQPKEIGPGGRTELGPWSPPSMLMTFETLGNKTLKVQDAEFSNIPSLLKNNWKVEEQTPESITFSFEVDAPPVQKGGDPIPLKVTKRYSLKRIEKDGDPAYDLDLQIEIENLSNRPHQVAYRLDGPNGLPLEGWWYSVKLHPEMFKGAGARDVVWRPTGQAYRLRGCPEIVSDARAAIKDDKPVEYSLLTGSDPVELDFAGVDCQFFSAVIMPKADDGKSPLLFSRLSSMPLQDVALLEKARNKTCNVTVRMVPRVENLKPSEKLTHSYSIFLGPKDPNVLQKYGISALIEYGWWYAAYPAKVLRFVLEFLYWIVGNYGIAIILLTLIVRSCMVPFSLKQAKSAALMQQLAPEMAVIKEKYADDMEKQGKAMRELYAKYNFNPFGGCLLLLFQLPVFVGLYRCLSVDIDLRDASLVHGWWWASNLAGPDMLWYWRDFITWPFVTDEAHGWLGPYFNLLPLFTIALFIMQQKMFTPPATDEQTKMQQNMMTYMTVFMGIMFYKVPAGLCLYFITSSLWSVIERKLITKPKPAGPGGTATTTTTTAPAPKPSGNGSSGTRPPKKKQKQKRR